MSNLADKMKNRLAVSNATTKTTAGNVTMTNEGIVYVNKSSGAATTVTLNPNPEKNWFALVVDQKGDAATNNITVQGADAETINGASTFVITDNYGAALFCYNGTEWNLVAYQSPATSGAGTKNGSTVAVKELGDGVIHKTVFTFTDHAIALTDNAGTVAYGGSKIYDFPEGIIMVLGASTDIALTKSSAGVNDDWDGDFGVGTVTASDNATLASTEQNIIPTTATPQATAGATTADGNSTAAVVIDGSATAADVYLNFLVDDADHDVTGTACNLIVNGTMTMVWTSLGDN